MHEKLPVIVNVAIIRNAVPLPYLAIFSMISGDLFLLAFADFDRFSSA